MRRPFQFIVALLSFSGVAAPPLAAEDRYEAEPIHYSASTPVNAISALQQKLDSASSHLQYDPQHGYLPSLLRLLEIPVESQVLVFSKTSFQSPLISPETPRALYFNDDTYLGVVPGGEVVEISTADPQLGAVFYTLPQEPAPRPQFVRRTQDCLQCHASSMTNESPGHLVRSVFTGRDGFPILKLGTSLTTQASPFSERWGGWYVTGTHGRSRHMGNVLVHEHNGEPVLDREAGANRTALDARVDASRYLSPHSDIVALMVLEHQAQMHNLIAEAAYATHFALRDQALVEQLQGTPSVLSESTQRRIASAGNRLLQCMLFVDEFALEDPVEGTSGFTERFSSQGPRDTRGRSLRDFDLRERLFQYPLSYLIYSPQFDALPQPMKEYLYRQLFDVLTGTIATPEYLHLTNTTSRAIREILLETKRGLPEYWRQGR